MKAKELAKILMQWPDFNVTTLGEIITEDFGDYRLTTHEIDVDDDTIEVDEDTKTIFIGELDS